MNSDSAAAQTRAGATLRPRLGAWILACAVGESIGMTAAATAARLGEQLPPAWALALVVAGGLVEGIALGALQAAWLARRFPGFPRAWWIIATVIVAGVGWSVASAPAVLGGQDGGPQPALGFIVVAAAGLGAVMGAVMGLAQGFVLRRRVAHPWRWVGISALAWAPAMVVIFAGATIPDATWATGLIVVWATIVGAVAGAVLGAVSAPLLVMLDGGRGARRVSAA